MKKKFNLEEHNQRLIDMIMNFFKSNPNGLYNYREITEGIGYKSRKKSAEIEDLLYTLKERGQLKELRAGRFCIPGRGNSSVIGTIDMNYKGEAFLIPEDRDSEPDDIYITSTDINGAMHGDKVEVSVHTRRKGHKPAGRVVTIIRRVRETYVGTIEIGPKNAFLLANHKQTGGHDIYIPLDALGGAQDGDKAVCKITRWDAGARNPEGVVVAVLGQTGENQTEMHAILAEYGLPYSYPEEVAREAEAIEPGITAEEVARRLDVRDVTPFTIDPADAKDFDDALSLRSLPDGNYEVGIHIADVTHYVAPGTVIDSEGYDRATSVYLVDRVVPMLPEKLSNFLCSLRPNEEKLTYSVIVTMNSDADIVKTKIAKTVICSDRRFTYEEAQQIIETGQGDYAAEVLKLNELAQKLRARRFKNGSVNFHRVEPRFTIDESGKPLSVYFKEAKESNMLVEEFMLLANRRVAEYIGKCEINSGKKEPKTFVYRVHDEPSEERYARFATFVRRFGYEANPKADETLSGAVNRIMDECYGKGEQNLVETLCLRTMAKAVYSTNNIGHYGLAFPHYTHFTSPIRRYPDMMVHRLLFSYMNGGKSVNAERYEEHCKHCSEREVLASDAERDSIKYKQVEYLLDHLGEEYDARVSGVTEWGVYAEIKENMCEGMISLRDLDDDIYYFDEENYCVVGHNTNKRYTIGDDIKIRIANADLELKQLTFALAGTPLLDIEKQNSKVREAGGSAPVRRRRAFVESPAKGRGGARGRRGRGSAKVSAASRIARGPKSAGKAGKAGKGKTGKRGRRR